MNTTKVIIISIITALVVSLGVGGLVLHQAASNGITFGTQVQNDLFYFTGGIKVGLSGQFAVDSSGNESATSLSINGASALVAFDKASYSFPTTALTLGGSESATSTTSTILSFPFGTAQFYVVGDGCLVSFNQSPTSTPFQITAILTSVATSTASATVSFANDGTSALTLNTTSSLAAGASSTLRLRCYR